MPWPLSPGCDSLTSTEKVLTPCEGICWCLGRGLQVCGVSWCVICDRDPRNFQSGPFAFPPLVSTLLVYSLEGKNLFSLVTSRLRQIYLLPETVLINPHGKCRNKQDKGEGEGQKKVWQGKTQGVGKVFILQILLWVIAPVDLFFPQWFCSLHFLQVSQPLFGGKQGGLRDADMLKCLMEESSGWVSSFWSRNWNLFALVCVWLSLKYISRYDQAFFIKNPCDFHWWTILLDGIIVKVLNICHPEGKLRNFNKIKSWQYCMDPTIHSYVLYKAKESW